MAHNRINLELRKDKPENVWRFIYSWEQSPCSHDADARYLFLHALVQWGEDREHMENVFTIAIQYSTVIGRNVDVSQPAHITEEDMRRVLDEFRAFADRRRGQR